MKKVLNVISTIFVWIVVLISVAMMVFTVVSVNTFDRGDRDLFGYKAFIVLSDSMSATDFDAGDLVLVKEVDPSTLQEGDIITYISQNEHNYGENVTHKIRSRTTTPDGSPGFITYGTTTDINDEAIVTYPYIQGQYILALTGVGTFFNFLKTPVGYILFILVPFLLLIAWQGINCIKAFRDYKKEQLAEFQREKDEIAAERKRTELMMQQLMQMQMQMQQMQQNPGQPVMQPMVQPMEQPAVQTPWEAPQEAPAPAAVPQPEPAPAAPATRVRPTEEWDLSLEAKIRQPRPQSRPAQPQRPAYPGTQAPAQRPARPAAPAQSPAQAQSRPAQPQRPAQPKPQAPAQRPARPAGQAPAQPRPAQTRTPAPPQSRNTPDPARQARSYAPVFDLPTVDHTDEDDLIAELSALCGRTSQ